MLSTPSSTGTPIEFRFENPAAYLTPTVTPARAGRRTQDRHQTSE